MSDYDRWLLGDSDEEGYCDDDDRRTAEEDEYERWLDRQAREQDCRDPALARGGCDPRLPDVMPGAPEEP